MKKLQKEDLKNMTDEELLEIFSHKHEYLEEWISLVEEEMGIRNISDGLKMEARSNVLNELKQKGVDISENDSPPNYLIGFCKVVGFLLGLLVLVMIGAYMKDVHKSDKGGLVFIFGAPVLWFLIFKFKKIRDFFED